ncbi:hypothetical protein CBL_12222 [Carabus blaptoides fortunei]
MNQWIGRNYAQCSVPGELARISAELCTVFIGVHRKGQSSGVQTPAAVVDSSVCPRISLEILHSMCGSDAVSSCTDFGATHRGNIYSIRCSRQYSVNISRVVRRVPRVAEVHPHVNILVLYKTCAGCRQHGGYLSPRYRTTVAGVNTTIIANHR